MSRFQVRGKVVDTVDLLRKRKLPWRLDVLPFAILYAAWIVTLIPSLDIVDSFIILGGLVAVHMLVFLFTVWSVDFKCFIQYSKVRIILTFDRFNYKLYCCFSDALYSSSVLFCFVFYFF